VGEPGRHYVKGNKSNQKDKYHVFSLICGSQKVDFMEVEGIRIMTSRGWRDCRELGLGRDWAVTTKLQ
jgi:hypothetical protein